MYYTKGLSNQPFTTHSLQYYSLVQGPISSQYNHAEMQELEGLIRNITGDG